MNGNLLRMDLFVFFFQFYLTKVDVKWYSYLLICFYLPRLFVFLVCGLISKSLESFSIDVVCDLFL